MDKPLRSLTFPGLPDTYIIPQGEDGKSAYELAVQEGYTGSLDDWLASLKGEPGTPGAPGSDGKDGATFTPSVAANGDLSWTNNGGLSNPATVNIKGQKGDTGADGTPGKDGKDGADGKNGATFTPAVSAGGDLSWTNDGSLQNPTAVNIKGPKGDAGKGFTILGYFASLAALQSAVPAPEDGDAYGVGAAAPYDIYVWDAVHSTWVNNGKIQGATGDTGPYFTPSVSESGDLSWTNNGGLSNPATVNIRGPKGETGEGGKTGAVFTPSVSESGDLSWTNNGGLSNPATVNIKGPRGDTGADGTPGKDGKDGADGKNGATFTPSVAANGDLSWTNNGGLSNPDSVNIVNLVLAKLPTWTGGTF